MHHAILGQLLSSFIAVVGKVCRTWPLTNNGILAVCVKSVHVINKEIYGILDITELFGMLNLEFFARRLKAGSG